MIVVQFYVRDLFMMVMKPGSDGTPAVHSGPFANMPMDVTLCATTALRWHDYTITKLPSAENSLL